MRGAGTDRAGIAEAAMIFQFYSFAGQGSADSPVLAMHSNPKQRLLAELANKK
jgi:hypothetical protein